MPRAGSATVRRQLRRPRVVAIGTMAPRLGTQVPKPGAGNDPGDGPGVTVSLDQPGTFQGSRPGAAFPVTGTYTQDGVLGGVAVSVSIGGMTFAATTKSDGTWTATVRVYCSGSLPVEAFASGRPARKYDDAPVTDTSATLRATVVLTNPLPSLSIASSSSQSVAEGAVCPVTLRVTTDDSSVYGRHQVTVSGPALVSPVTLTATDATTYVGTATVAPVGGTVLGTHQLRVQALPLDPATGAPMPRIVVPTGSNSAASYPLVAETTTTVECADVTPPRIRITFPPDPATPTPVAELASVTVRGTVQDIESGTQSVWVSLTDDRSTGIAADLALGPTPQSPATWSAAVAPVPTAGASRLTVPLYVWAEDVAGTRGETVSTLDLILADAYAPETLEARLGTWAYLGDLVTFACTVLDTSGRTGDPRPSDLAAFLRQPVETLSEPASSRAVDRTAEPVNELRVPVEVLRLHLRDAHVVEAVPVSGPVYLAAAYDALLAGYGTSYAQLRAARVADADTRAAIGAAIGVAVAPTDARPDELDRLTVDPPDLSDAVLQELFGWQSTDVADITDGLADVPAPSITAWQMQALRNTWLAADEQPGEPAAVVDPDLISDADLVAPDGPVRELLDRRDADLAGVAARLGAVAGPDDAARFAALLVAGLPATFDFGTVVQTQLSGSDVADDLASAGLDQVGFAFLQSLAVLVADRAPGSGAASGFLTTAEWSDAVDVLVAAWRRTRVPTWSNEEIAAGITTDPAVFRDSGFAPERGRFRTQTAARAVWTRTLRARSAQVAAVEDTSSAAVIAAETAALPLLRDALLDAIVAATEPVVVPTPTRRSVGDDLTARYFVDVLAGGTLTTDRATVAATSLQAFLRAVRADAQLPANEGGPTWSVAHADGFDSAWATIGSLGAWTSAMTVYLFPESSIGPLSWAGSARASDHYRTLVQGLQSGGIAAAGALDQMVDGGPALTSPLGVYEQAVVGTTLHGAVDTFFYTPDDLSHQDNFVNIATKALAQDPNRADGVVEVFWAVPMLIGTLAAEQGLYDLALRWFSTLVPFRDPAVGSMFAPINDETRAAGVGELPGAQLARPVWTVDRDPFGMLQDPATGQVARPAPYLRATILAITGCLAQQADALFSAATTESTPRARDTYLAAVHLTAHPCFTLVEPQTAGQRAYPLPRLVALELAVTTRLGLLRQGRNIAGQVLVPVRVDSAVIAMPTQYPYRTLLTRAQQLTSQATALEAQFESALVALDAKNLQVLSAQQAVATAGAQISVQFEQLRTAQAGEVAATAQVAKASAVLDGLDAAIAAPPNRYEQDLLQDYAVNGLLQVQIAQASAVVGIAGAVASASTMTSWTAAGAAIAESIGYGVKATLEQAQAVLQVQTQADALRSSIEQRRQQWQMQLAGAQGDRDIASAQRRVAADQTATASAQLTVATLQARQAAETLAAIEDQAMSAVMYSWLVDVLGGIYRDFLQRATATAQLAQAQLGFERVEAALTLIRSDYWAPPAALTGQGAPGNTLGLTAAEQLQQDLAHLDEYAFSTDARRLNISQSFSLAQMLPVDFLAFKQTGTITFRTPMAWFDADFPGHYLRLVRQVQLSIVALIPPDRGIRATLSNSGVSTIVTQTTSGFGAVTLQRAPESVAVTAAVNASGVFTTDLQPQMLLPFEGSGVETTWTLELPPGANPIDYGSVLDAVITIDFTARADIGYRETVVHQLNADTGRAGDVVLSLARDYPDQWYGLCNPVDTTSARPAVLDLPQGAFPRQVTDLGVGNLTLRLLSDTTPLTACTVVVGRAAGSAPAQTGDDGIAGTRRGAQEWTEQFGGGDPTGAWMITLDATAGALIDAGTVTDVLVDITWTGTGPTWRS